MASTSRVMAVTGANKGIGFEVTRRLLVDNPDATVLVAARSEERGKAAVKKLDNPRARFVPLDLADAASITAFAALLDADYGRLDVLVANAGVLGMDPADTRTSVAVNYTGNMRLARAVAHLLSPGGRAVFVSSRLGSLAALPSAALRARLTAPDLTVDALTAVMDGAADAADAGGAAGLTAAGWDPNPYGVSKVGLTTLVRLLGRDEVRPDVWYHAVCPGLTSTGENDDAIVGLPGIVPLAQGAEGVVWATRPWGGGGGQWGVLGRGAAGGLWGPGGLGRVEGQCAQGRICRGVRAGARGGVDRFAWRGGGGGFRRVVTVPHRARPETAKAHRG
eukprot:TRINITY_DN2570_c0_g1_i1.p1 TRINITY_DN2570_c0_g1~~TRINITY_DN2570_c0_g1_i1.p1  ORF type:complete len:335 (+),score=96.82 TRINITY_DN2570_c0_g1_i1:2367-3371(+)